MSIKVAWVLVLLTFDRFDSSLREEDLKCLVDIGRPCGEVRFMETQHFKLFRVLSGFDSGDILGGFVFKRMDFPHMLTKPIGLRRTHSIGTHVLSVQKLVEQHQDIEHSEMIQFLWTLSDHGTCHICKKSGC